MLDIKKLAIVEQKLTELNEISGDCMCFSIEIWHSSGSAASARYAFDFWIREKGANTFESLSESIDFLDWKINEYPSELEVAA